MMQKLLGYMRRIDWRAWVVLAALGFTIAITIVVYLLQLVGLDLKPENQFGAIFAGWVSGVALFAVLGVVVAIVSLEPPEKESFDSRARILFRRQTGNHIDYIVGRIKTIFEHYAESNVVTITIIQYHSVTKKYRLNIVHESKVLSYIDDTETSYESQIEYTGVTLPPRNGATNRLIYIRIDGQQVEGPMEFRTRINKPIRTIVQGDKACDAAFNIEFWINADTEPNQLVCSRYTQKFQLFFENHLDQAVTIQMLPVLGSSQNEFIIPAGERRSGVELRDREPDALVCDFRIRALR